MRKALALSALPLVFLFVTAFQSSNSVPGQLAAIQAKLDSLEAKVASSVPRKFYLTKSPSEGSNALAACAVGYHMASLWEIKDVSNLRYNTDLGFTRQDSGLGPPEAIGWIRTGEAAFAGNITGRANCNAWTSASVSDFGTVVGLGGAASVWDSPNVFVVSPWNTTIFACGSPMLVWCVQD